MVTYRVSNKINPPKMSRIKIKGDIEHQFDNLIFNRLNSHYARNVIYRECEDFFREKEDDMFSYGLWRGEFWGKWVICASRVARYTNDDELKEFIRKGALSLISTAREDGYIGTYVDSKKMFAADPEVTVKEIGWHCDWNWNVWCRKYTLWGLLEAYMLTEDKAILEGADRHASQLIGDLHELNTHLCYVGVMRGLPAFSILKPMLVLYRLTGNKKYLDFCLEEAAMWEKEDGPMPNLIANGLKNIPLHDWYKETWTKKAYEMMSCLDGILELYRITGEKKYLTSVENIYEQLKAHELNPMFSVGYNDKFDKGAYRINGISEPCDVIHWMRVCYELFALTGEMKYMDSIELAFYNAFLASSFADGKWGSRGVRTMGRHFVAHGQAKSKYQHCCVNNLHRGFINAAECFAMTSDNEVYINFFTEYKGELRAKGGKVKIEIGGRVFETGVANITLDIEGPTNFRIRIPSWSNETLVFVNGSEIRARKGEYFPLTLARGQHNIEIKFDIKTEIIEFPYEVNLDEYTPQEIYQFTEGSGPFNIKREAMIDKKMAKVMYGPILLTRSKSCGNTEEEMFSGETICGKGYSVKLTPVPSKISSYTYEAEFSNGTDTFTTNMCDYGTGTNFELEQDDKFFNIYI